MATVRIAHPWLAVMRRPGFASHIHGLHIHGLHIHGLHIHGLLLCDGHGVRIAHPWLAVMPRGYVSRMVWRGGQTCGRA